MTPIEVIPEDFEAAARIVEEEERWRKAHRIRARLITALDYIIGALENLQNRLRWW